MKTPLLVLSFLLLLPQWLVAAGMVSNENFMVFTPAELSGDSNHEFAEQVLERAEQYRQEIAREWLSEELPPSVGRTIINVSFSETTDAGLTWAIDSPRRKYHTLYLKTSRRQALGSTLAHEMVHVVLATRFPHPNRLPAWLEEGIACRYDDKERIAKRKRIADWYVRTGNWPHLQTVLNAENIVADDQSSYAVAGSLTEYLLSRGGKEALLAFGESAVREGYDRALRKHYNVRDIAELQSAWQSWAETPNRVAGGGPLSTTP